MTDVHAHILPFVDDGSASVEDSISLVKTLVSQGVDKIILTPHYKVGRYEQDNCNLKAKFEEFCKVVEDNGINVKLYLGEEIFCDKKIYDLLKENKVLTINETKYILIEFDYFNYIDISDYVFNLKTLGYIPVIAHIERYSYLNIETLIDIKSSGALIQVNASSVTGDSGKQTQKKVLATIKCGLVDFVTTDIHNRRHASLEKAYAIIKKKFSKTVADNLFENNAKIFNL